MHYLGIDVSKAKLHCTWFRPETGKLQSKSLPNDAGGHAALLAWLRQRKGVAGAPWHAVLEATGVYHEAVALALHQAGVRVSVVNPAQVKDFARGLAVRSKSDARDSAVLARYGALVQPSAWAPPPPEVRELRALLQRLEAIETDLRRELNRLEKSTVSAAPRPVHDSLQTSLGFLHEQKARLEQEIDDHINRYPGLREERARLLTIPAVGPKTALRVLTVLRARTFRRAEQAAAYLGLVPVECTSGTSLHKRPRLSKAGDARVRAALYMAAVVAIRHNPDVRALYQRLIARGKAKMAALGAAMRKLVHICFGVLKHRCDYRPQVGLCDA